MYLLCASLLAIIVDATHVDFPTELSRLTDAREPFTDGWEQHRIDRKYIAEPYYASGSSDSNFLEPAAATDGRYDWDEEEYTNGNWNPNASPDQHGAIKSTRNAVMHIDFPIPAGEISHIKIYPRKDCCIDFYGYEQLRAYLVDAETGGLVSCWQLDYLLNNPTYTAADLREVGIRYLCSQPASGKISQVYLTAGSDPSYGFIVFNEIEFFGGIGETTIFYEPNNLMLRNYAPELLFNFANQSETITEPSAILDKLLTHGCWCAKLDKTNPYLEFLGGPDPVDELDELCKNWFKCRNCNDQLRGGSCNIENSSSRELLKAKSYTMTSSNVEFINTVACLTQSDSCADDTCSIDLYYLKEIYNYLEDNHQTLESIQVVDNSTCSAALNVDKKRICTGSAPYLTPKVYGPEIYTQLNDGWFAPPSDYSSCPPGNEQYRGFGVVYKVFYSSSSWYQANMLCQNLGDGIQLARVFCDVENNFVANLIDQTLQERGATYNHAWIGGYDGEEEGVWRWNDGTTTESSNMVQDGIPSGIKIEEEGLYTNWWPGEPNNHEWTPGQNEHCIQANWSRQPKWTDHFCSDALPGYVCEKRFY